MRQKRLRVLPHRDSGEAWFKVVVCAPEGAPGGNLRKMRFARSWIEYDFQVEKPGTRGRANWDIIWGIVLVLGISAGFWAGVGLLVRHYWK